MIKAIISSAKFIAEFAKTRKFKQFVMLELITCAMFIAIVFGAKAYVNYSLAKEEAAAYERVDRETIKRGVEYLIQYVEQNSTEEQQ